MDMEYNKLTNFKYITLYSGGIKRYFNKHLDTSVSCVSIVMLAMLFDKYLYLYTLSLSHNNEQIIDDNDNDIKKDWDIICDTSFKRNNLEDKNANN